MGKIRFEDMRRRVPCVDKLVRYLGWAPSVPLEQNLTRIINHMQSELSRCESEAASIP
jgi:nucleoside-diphosphate-sugar epimerase